MKNESKVSVVMSVYNGEKYLREAIDSVLNQTFKDFEFIIINDGSTDETQEILESYNDSRIILIHQKNMGLTKSLNKGIALAKGEYIARQDADDISMPERLEKQIEFLKHHKSIILLGTAAQIIDEKGVHLYTTEYPCDYSSIRKAMKHNNYFIHGSVMFRRQYFFEVGGYRELFFTAQDCDLWLRFIERFEAANLATPLYKKRFDILSYSFKNLVSQKRMATFARQLARVRKKGISETSLIKRLKNFLDSPLTLVEKREIINIYNPWGLLLLKNNKRKEAFSLMDEGVKYHPSNLYKLFFKFVKGTRSTLLLEILIKTSVLFYLIRSSLFNF